MGGRKKARAEKRRNARKEQESELGVYEAHITALQKSRLARMPQELKPEIALLRALVDDCLRRMEESREEEQRKNQFNAALAALQRLFTAMRTQNAQSKAAAEKPDLFEETLSWVQAELGLEG